MGQVRASEMCLIHKDIVPDWVTYILFLERGNTLDRLSSAVKTAGLRRMINPAVLNAHLHISLYLYLYINIYI